MTNLSEYVFSEPLLYVLGVVTGLVWATVQPSARSLRIFPKRKGDHR